MIITDESTIEDVLKVLPQDELDKLSAYGDTRDDARWYIGGKAYEWIDRRGLPVMQICKIVGKLTDYGHERIRQLLYTSRFYAERPELREKYQALRYSIFEYARQCDDAETVLKSAQDGNLSLSQVKFTNLPLLDSIKEAMTRVPKKHEKQAREIMQVALGKIRELIEK